MTSSDLLCWFVFVFAGVLLIVLCVMDYLSRLLMVLLLWLVL